MDWISLIPVRAGSKGLANKNIRQISGKPLYEYTVDFALSAGTSCVYVTTDIPEILSVAPKTKVIINKRKKRLCKDDTPMSSVILDFLEGKEGIKIRNDQIIVLLQATSPLRKKLDLISALNQFIGSQQSDLMMAVTEAENNVLKYGYVADGNFKHISKPHLCFENRQNLPKLYRPTGAFYIFRAGWYRKNKTLATPYTGAYELKNNQSLDIDTLEDFKKFEAIIKNKGHYSENC